MLALGAIGSQSHSLWPEAERVHRWPGLSGYVSNSIRGGTTAVDACAKRSWPILR